MSPFAVQVSFNMAVDSDVRYKAGETSEKAAGKLSCCPELGWNSAHPNRHRETIESQISTKKS
jgi:hypothetical protein